LKIQIINNFGGYPFDEVFQKQNLRSNITTLDGYKKRVYMLEVIFGRCTICEAIKSTCSIEGQSFEAS